VTPEDHEGGGWVRLYQTKEERLVPVTDWFRGYRDLVLEEVHKAAKAEEKNPSERAMLRLTNVEVVHERTIFCTCKNRWCPSIACITGLQRDAGRWLIESVDACQIALQS
jgi:hypothetical protein